MKKIIITLLITICFSFFHCNEEKDKQPPQMVNPLEDRTLLTGFGTDMIDIQNVFNTPNNDIFTFNTYSSNDEVVSVTIFQNNQLVIHESNVGKAKITITANDAQKATTFTVKVIGRESLLACDFEVCPSKFDRDTIVKIARELMNVRAKVVKINTIHEYGITIDSFYLENPGPPLFENYPDPEGLAYLRLLVPCRMIDTRFRVNEKQVIISGYVLNCSAGLTLPNIRGSGGRLFELTDIKEFSSNTN